MTAKKFIPETAKLFNEIQPHNNMKHTPKRTPDQLAVEKAMRALAALTIVMIVYIALVLKGGGM